MTAITSCTIHTDITLQPITPLHCLLVLLYSIVVVLDCSCTRSRQAKSCNMTPTGTEDKYLPDQVTSSTSSTCPTLSMLASIDSYTQLQFAIRNVIVQHKKHKGFKDTVVCCLRNQQYTLMYVCVSAVHSL